MLGIEIFRRVRGVICVSFLLGSCLTSSQASDVKEGCFDFNTRVVQPLRDPILLTVGRDNSASGKLPNDVDWGAARGIIAAPVTEVYQKLLDHTVWKDPKKNDLEVEIIQKAGYVDFHLLKDTINPVPFIHISWVEQWAYALIDGTKSDVKKMVISYQKASGTSHLEHLCGSVLLQPALATSPASRGTDVFLYEEAKSSHRDAGDIVESHLGTLRTLREVTTPRPEAKPSLSATVGAPTELNAGRAQTSSK